jgi:hypothetical protein
MRPAPHARRVTRAACLVLLMLGLPLASRAAKTEPAATLPPAEETAREYLESRRVTASTWTSPTPAAPLRSWVVYPERRDKAGVWW